MTKSEGSRKILWIGWDGADWEHITPLLEQGLLPNLEKLINGGVMGNLATLQPVLSPMLWNSASTGKYAFKHGIHGFVEPDHINGGSRIFSSHSRKCKAVWNILSQQGYKSNVINWWGSHPAEKINGCVISNLFGGISFGPKGPVVRDGVVHPAEKSRFYGQFKVDAHEFESEQICAFIPKAGEINQEEDSRLETFCKTFAETLTTHSVATAVMEMEPWDFMAVYYTCIDHFGHGFMQYHPPRMAHVPEKDFEIFKDVIAGAYRFSDMMLGRKMEMCDENTTIVLCSDHGFQSGSQRPPIQPREPSGPAIWHRQYGIIVMNGPNIKKDERIYGASLIDITPTLLAIMGMPIGEDMDGRPLLESFIDPPEIKTIPSWDSVDGEFDDGMPGDEVAMPAEESTEVMQQFVALGYIDDPSGNKAQQFANADIEAKYNCAINYMFARRPDDALPLFQELVDRAPWESRFIPQLAQCYHKCGFHRQAKNLIEAVYDVRNTKSVSVKVLWAEINLSLGDGGQEVVDVLADAEQNNKFGGPDLMSRIGRLYGKLRRWPDAERVFKRTLEIHPENAFALQSLSRVYCRTGRNQETVDAALGAVSLVHRSPLAHLNMGIALARSGDPKRAVTAFNTAISFSPGFVLAHRWLATIHRSQLNDNELANFHARQASKYSTKTSVRNSDHDERREQTFDIPAFATEVDRLAILIKKRPNQKDQRQSSGKEFVLVSGLPRSGTSLMMQMLELGGLPARTDGVREADIDNPRGYYEWEAIKKIKRAPGLMDEEGLGQKAIKVISALLSEMPYSHRYKIIFMTRPIDEVVASQASMIERLDSKGAPLDEDSLKQSLVRHRDQVLASLRKTNRIEFIEVDFPTLVEAPGKIVPRIVEFLGSDRLPTVDQMVNAIDRSLHRNKKPVQ